MAEEGPPLKSCLSQKSMSSQKSLPSQLDTEKEEENTVSKILEGKPSFSLPDTSEDSAPKLRHFDEKDFKSHRNEALHVHHPLRVLTRKSSKGSLKRQSSTPVPVDTSLQLSTPSGQSRRATFSNPPSGGLIRPTDLTLDTSLSIPKISVTTPSGGYEKKKLTRKSAIFTIGGEEDEEDDTITPLRESVTFDPTHPTGAPLDVSASQDESQRRHSHHHHSRSHHKHHHHHHHHHKGRHSAGDLLTRTRKGSHVALEELAEPQKATEPEEAATLNMADLEQMAEHRLGVVHKRHKHKPSKRERVHSMIHVARSRHSSAASWASELDAVLDNVKTSKEEEADKQDKKGKKGKFKKKKSVQFKKQYDHRPHEVFVELDELFKEEGHELQWKEKARWIKYEEDVEEGANRWGKPHIASLTFHSLVELRKLLEHGSVLLDLEEWELNEIFHRVTDNMITSDQVTEENRGEVLRSLLIKHKHVSEKSILRNMSQLSLSSLGRTSSDANIRHGLFRGLQSPTDNHGRNRRSSSFVDFTGMYKPIKENEGNHSNNASKDDVRIDMTSHDEDSNPLNGFGPQLEQRERKQGYGNLALMDPQTTATTTAQKKDEPGLPHKSASALDIARNVSDLHVPLAGRLSNPRHTSPDVQKEVTGLKAAKQKLDGIMRKIPKDAEATTVLVGELTALDKPALCFVRLAEGTILNGLTEVPIPVRFLFVLLGPGGEKVDYHEIGRCFSTLMNNEHFHEIAYKADSMDDILSALNEFVEDTVVLPAGNWDKDLLLPILRDQNQKLKERYQKEIGADDEKALLDDKTDGAVSMYKKSKKAQFIDPLKRTGKLFGGLINDVKRRYPHFISDFTDALNMQCVATVFFLFFAAMAPVITFGGVLSEGTKHYMGVSEMILGSAICGIIFALFSGQPITIIGVTGPILVFEETLFMFCKSYGIDYLPFRFWVGMWIFLITIVTVAVEASVLVRYFTRFTEEIFSFLIAILFLKEVGKKTYKIFVYNPLKEDYCYSKYKYSPDLYHPNATDLYHHNATEWPDVTGLQSVVETVTTVVFDVVTEVATNMTTDGYEYKKCVAIPKPPKYQPNTALLSVILTMGTFILAWFFKVLKGSKFFGKKGRQMIGDFGTSIAIMIMVALDLAIDTVYTEKIYIPDGFQPTDSCKRGWLVNPLGTDKSLEVYWIFAAAIPGFLAFILLYMETLIDGLIVDNPKNKLKKGSGFHLDLLLLGGLAALNGLLGLPWVWAATVRSVTHLHSLCVWSKSHAPGEKPRLLRVREQRVTALVVNVLVGICILFAPLLNQIPVSVLFGVFLYMGVSSLNGIQMLERCFFLAMPSKHHSDAQYVRGVRTWRMHLYTLIQLACVILLAVIKSTNAAMSFPFFLMLLVPIRLLLNKVFTKKELLSLDSHEDEDDDDHDAFQEAHMPV